MDRYEIVRYVADGSFKFGFVAIDRRCPRADGSCPEVFLGVIKTGTDLVLEKRVEMQLSRQIQSMGDLFDDARSRLVRTHFVSEKDKPAEFRLSALNRTVQLHCVIQDLCDGGDLYGYMNTGDSFPEGVARHFFAELMRGIHELHCRSMYHLDIKIENVLVVKDQASGEYSLRLGDMGFMRLFSMDGARLPTNAAATTLNLVKAKNEGVLPPEHLELRPFGGLAFNTKLDLMNPAKADVWAAGEVLLWLVGLKPLMTTSQHRLVWASGRRTKRMMVTLKEKPIQKRADGSWEPDLLDDLQHHSLGRDALRISPDLLELLRCMLQSDRDLRPTAKEVLTQLEASSVPAPSLTEISVEMNRRVPKTLIDGERNAQTYDGTCAPSTNGQPLVPHVFQLLRNALGRQHHGWAVDYRDPMCIIEHHEHIVVCQVLQTGKIHYKWEKGMSFPVWLEICSALKDLLDSEPGFTPAQP
jgi:serine/threonine protein kinase